MVSAPLNRPGYGLRAGLTLAAFVLSFLVGACVSYSTPEDFNKALKRAQSGEAAEVLREMRQRFGGMSESERQEAVRILAQIKEPDASAFLKDIVRGEKNEPIVRREALGALTRRNEPGTPEFARDSVAATGALLSEPVAEYLIERQPEKTAAALHQAAKDQRPGMPENVIRFLGAQAYTPAIPDLKKSVDEGHHPVAALTALADMKDPDADAYLFAAAGNKDHKQRGDALRLALSKRGASHPKEVSGLLRDVLANADKENEQTVLVALDLAPKTDADDVRESLKRVYRESRKEEYRTRALAALAKMEKTNPFILTREMQVSLISLQIGMARWKPDLPVKAEAPGPAVTVPEKPPRRVARQDPMDEPKSAETREPIRSREAPGRATETTRTEPRPRRTARTRSSTTSRSRPARSGAASDSVSEKEGRIPASAKYPRSSDAYRAQFYKYLLESLPEEDAREIYGKISNALRAYSTSTSPSGQFIRRSYAREYGTTKDAELAQLLDKGVSHPGSVHAVLLGIFREYPNDALRTYAISQLFGLPRWQSAVVLGFIRR